MFIIFFKIMIFTQNVVFSFRKSRNQNSILLAEMYNFDQIFLRKIGPFAKI